MRHGRDHPVFSDVTLPTRCCPPGRSGDNPAEHLQPPWNLGVRQKGDVRRGRSAENASWNLSRSRKRYPSTGGGWAAAVRRWGSSPEVNRQTRPGQGKGSDVHGNHDVVMVPGFDKDLPRGGDRIGERLDGVLRHADRKPAHCQFVEHPVPGRIRERIRPGQRRW